VQLPHFVSGRSSALRHKARTVLRFDESKRLIETRSQEIMRILLVKSMKLMELACIRNAG